MGLRYQQTVTLAEGHAKGIAAVAFSLEGKTIATAGMDGRVCVWDAEEGRLLHRYSGKSAVLCLVWVTSGEETLLFGTQDGNIGMLTMATALNDLSMSGFWAHTYPVEHLAIAGDLVASGAFAELKVWRWSTLEQRFSCEQDIPEPPKTSHNEHHEVLVTSVHWTGTQDRPLVLVTYMYHGCHLIDATTWQNIRTISLQGKIARASLSPDGSLLAVSNLVTGFDVYRTDTEQPVATYRQDVGGNPQPIPVLFIHGGQAIVGGSTLGLLNIWDVKMGKLHALSLPNHPRVLALAAHCQPMPHGAPYRFRIATGIFNQDSDTLSSCIIWEAQTRDPSDAESPDIEATPAANAEVDAESPVHTSSSRGYLSWMTLSLWLALSVSLIAYGLAVIPDMEDLGDRYSDKRND